MPDFKPVDQSVLSDGVTVNSSSSNLPVLVPLNTNSAPSTAENPDSDSKPQDSAADAANGNTVNDPSTKGSTSSSKRSKRPHSNALMQAKLQAQMRKKGSNSDVEIIIKDHLQPARDAKDQTQKQTGVIYDMRMVEHQCLWDPDYPEKPERFSVIINRCLELGLLQRCKSLAPRFGTEEEILTLHPKEQIDKLRSVSKEPDLNKVEEFASLYDAVYFHPTTFDLSLLSVGCTIDLVNAILDGGIQNGMAIIRPPGHHAMKSEFCGYCYFNNVAIAAKNALDQGKAKKILIVDYDVHHGQATQQMFYDDPRVLYFSTHRYEHGLFWPNLRESDFHYIGSSDGVGFNCNIPLNKTGMGNGDFLSIWMNVLLPMAFQFNPDLIIVSSGYDACLGCFEFNPDLVMISSGYDSAFGDEKGEMVITPQFYPHLIAPLMGLANGKVAVILEGGYCLKSLAEGAALSLRALLGDPCPRISPTLKPCPEVADAILSSIYVMKPHWGLLVGQRSVYEEEQESKSEKGLIHLPKVSYLWDQPKPTKYMTRDCYPVQNPELSLSLDRQLDELILNTSLQKSANRVGLVYSDAMLTHRNSHEPGHPERPERISNIFACHGDYGLVERCLKIEPRDAVEEELLLVHTAEHIDKMKKTQNMSQKELYKLKDDYNSIYFHVNTYQAALVAAGSLLQVVDNVLNNVCQSGVAIIRPPGHHAEVDQACGFCIFNNVSLAAKYAIETHGLKRIMILDWDVHHGNGIQRMFYSDPRVLYVSIHRYDHGTFFPSSEEANYDYVGSGFGLGYNVNIPWNKGSMTDTEYLSAFTNIILPIAYEYSPELILVSAGFDAAKGDPLGGCKVTPEGYALMTHLLTPLANGNIILALEGGYNLTAIAYSMTLCTKALLGDPIPRVNVNDEVDPLAVKTIRDTMETLSSHWQCLQPFRMYFPISKNLVPLGNYSKIEDVNNDNVVNNNAGVQTPTEPSSTESNVIPDSPIASGEPSLSTPRSLQPEVVENSAGLDESGSGESGVPPVEAAAAALDDQGAAGQTTFVLDIQALSRLMINDNAAEGDQKMYLVDPLKWCPHVDNVAPVPSPTLNTDEACQVCRSTEENWICLICYSVCCSRYVREHMVIHSHETGHQLALSCQDLSVWCFSCNNYIDNEKFYEAINAAHIHKHGVSLPTPPVITNPFSAPK